MTMRRPAVFFDPTKSTSGQRFYDSLCAGLKSLGASAHANGPEVVLFNVSAKFWTVLRARLRGQRIVVRVDGLYFDRLCEPFLARFRWPTRTLLKALAAMAGLRGVATHLANLIDQNWTAFARIALAHHVVYQSLYSREVHRTYFPHKPSCVIVNGSRLVVLEDVARPPRPGPVELVSIFDDWKPAKRMVDLIDFVRWANETAGQPVHLTLLGYTGRWPACVAADVAALAVSAPYITTLPRFTAFDGAVRDALLAADMYVTFTFRDPCPNVVVEAMAHGLPVLGLASGGLPDIVGDAGVLLPDADRGEFFAASRFECDFPPIDFERVLQAALAIRSDAAAYRARVRRRFDTDLGMDVVAERYMAVLRDLA